MVFKVLYEVYNITVPQQIQDSTTVYKTSQTECNNNMQRLVARQTECNNMKRLVAQSLGNSILLALPHLSRRITVNYI
jgi:hypothetical protein